MKKFTASLIMVTIILFGSLTVYAAALQAKINVTPDKTEVENGDSVVFTITISNIANAQDDLVTAIEGNVKYDTNFFESMTYTGITINTNTGKFSKIDSFTNNSNIGTIILKVKKDATGTGEVKFEGLKADDGRDDYTQSTAITPDVIYNITLKEKQQEDQKQSESEDKTEEETKTSESGDKVEEEKKTSENGNQTVVDTKKSENENKSVELKKITEIDNTAATTILPKTGNRRYAIIIIIAIISIILVVKYRKYRKIKF